MPKYRNIGNEPVVVLDRSWKINEEKEIEFYVDPVQHPTLKMTDPNPTYNPIIFSQTCSSGSSFDVTANTSPDACMMRIVSLDAISSISFNGNSETAYVPQASPLELRPIHRYDKIKVNSGKVSIEIWKSLNWRG